MAGGASAVSLLALLAPIPPTIGANLAVGRSWAPIATRALIAATAAAVILLGLLDLSPAGREAGSSLGLGLGTIATGLLTLLVMRQAIRQWLAGFLPFEADHPVHAFALALSISVFGVLLSQQLFSDLARQEAASALPLTPGDVVLQEVPFGLLGFAGIGVLIRRAPAGSLMRLGLVKPSLSQILLAAAATGFFLVVSLGMDELAQRLTPDLARQTSSANSRLFGGLSSPLGIAAIALAPGFCEEVLFRGALQPRLGLAWTALLFTAFHAQYGLSLDALTVLVLSVGLGLIRRHANTTTSVLTHVSFNGLQAAGLVGSLGWPLITQAAVVLALFAVVAYRTQVRPLRNP